MPWELSEDEEGFDIPDGWPKPLEGMSLEEYIEYVWSKYGHEGSASDKAASKWWDSHRAEWEELSPSGMAATG